MPTGKSYYTQFDWVFDSHAGDSLYYKWKDKNLPSIKTTMTEEQARELLAKMKIATKPILPGLKVDTSNTTSETISGKKAHTVVVDEASNLDRLWSSEAMKNMQDTIYDLCDRVAWLEDDHKGDSDYDPGPRRRDILSDIPHLIAMQRDHDNEIHSLTTENENLKARMVRQDLIIEGLKEQLVQLSRQVEQATSDMEQRLARLSNPNYGVF